MAEVTIVEATGYAGGNHGPTLPLIQIAMAVAVADCDALGIKDDTPNARLVEIVGIGVLDEMFGEKAGEVIGADYIRSVKLEARAAAADTFRGLVKLHEGSEAAKLHADR
jgi:hypothetical protein